MKIFKKILCLIFASALLIPLFSMPAFAEDNAESSAGSDAGKISSMLVYGDSLATGYRLENYSRFDNSGPADSFPNLLCKNYALEYDKNFFNYAKTGEDSTKTLAAVKNTSPELIKNADVIIISTGGNDVMDIVELALYQIFVDEKDNLEKIGIEVDLSSLDTIEKTIISAFSNPKAKSSIDRMIKKCSDITVQNSFSDTVLLYEANVKEMISFIRETGSEAEIFFITPYDPTSMLSGNAIIESINKMLTDISNKTLDLIQTKEYGYKLHAEDLLNEFRDNLIVWTNIITFDIHPNKDGHRHIYEMLVRDISSAVSAKEEAVMAQAEKSAPYSNTVVYILFGAACVCVTVIVRHTVLTHRRKS